MRNFLTTVFITGVCICLLQSCIKSDTKLPKSTYTIKGQLLSVYDSTPISNFNIILVIHTGYMGAEKREIGNTYTDVSGNFIFGNINTRDNNHLGFREDLTSSFRITPVPKDGDTVDIGIIRTYP